MRLCMSESCIGSSSGTTIASNRPLEDSLLDVDDTLAIASKRAPRSVACKTKSNDQNRAKLRAFVDSNVFFIVA